MKPTIESIKNWRENLKPKVRVSSECDEGAKRAAQEILDVYWKDLEPEIEILLAQAKKEGAQEKVKEINDKWLSLHLEYSRTPKEIDEELCNFGVYMQKVYHDSLKEE